MRHHLKEGLAAAALLLATPLAAGIPEPDNAVYGEITLDGAPLPAAFEGVQLVARRVLPDGSAGGVLSKYSLGDHPAAGSSRYVIKVKVDTDTVTRPGALLRGEKFALFLDGVQISPTFSSVGIGNTTALFRRADLELGDLRPEQLAIIAHLIGASELTDFQRAAADYNADETIDSGDVKSAEDDAAERRAPAPAPADPES